LFASRILTKQVLRLVRTVGEAEKLVAHIMSGTKKCIAVDCEGVRLGRFGKLSLMQIATGEELVLVDAIDKSAVNALGPILTSSSIKKVMHDCREDSSALFHQHGIKLGNVFDTQVANLIIQRESKEFLHQKAYTDLLHQYLGVESNENAEIKARMIEDPLLWHKRPLSMELVKYALHGVEHLLHLSASLSKALGVVGVPEEEVFDASKLWTEYSGLNREIQSPQQAWKIGTPLLGMVAAINAKGVYFKLNLSFTGVCCTPSALKRMLKGTACLPPVQVGDTVELAVSGASVDGKIIYVDRRDPDWEFFDFLRRPSPKKRGTASNEYKHEPSLIGEPDVDPLLRRGLGEDGGVDSDDEDQIDHEPILTQKPKP
jgi:exonuclease 3'-5' domain-containing protein 1